LAAFGSGNLTLQAIAWIDRRPAEKLNMAFIAIVKSSSKFHAGSENSIYVCRQYLKTPKSYGCASMLQTMTMMMQFL
jgi:hypothetical protein